MSSTKVLSDAGIASTVTSMVGGMGIVLKHWTVGNLCRVLNEMDLRVVAATSAGKEGLDSLECSVVGYDRPPPILVDYGQKLGRCGRSSVEHSNRHSQDLVPYTSLFVLSVPSFCSPLKQAFKITFLEDCVVEYSKLLKTLKFLMLPTRCLHEELEYCLENLHKQTLWVGARTDGSRNPCRLMCSF